MANLRVTHIKKSFGNKGVIDDISFQVEEGQFCILLGPSGCGKTTLLRLIAGLEEQDSGQIHIGDREVSSLTPRERDVAMVFQSYALYPHLSVYENMAFSLSLKKLPRDEIRKIVNEAAALLDIGELLHRKPKELSGGQRQRVAIGRAIVRKPSLFLFDEPLSNLDAKLRSSMRVELAKLHHELKSTMVYVTHDQTEAMTLGQKIILLDSGIIQQEGSPDDLYRNPSNLFVAQFIGSPRINLVRGRILIRKEQLLFVSGGLMIDLGDDESLKRFTDKEMIMGIRPESLTPGDGPISGEVELIEHLGPETLVYVKVDNSVLIGKALPECDIRRGQNISLNLRKTGVHFFHKGERISRP